jgi:hypothetical protein
VSFSVVLAVRLDSFGTPFVLQLRKFTPVTPQCGEATQPSGQVALPQSHDPAKKTVPLPDATWASTSPEEPGSQLSVTFDHQGAPSYITLLLLPVFPSSPSSLLLSSPYMYDQARVRCHKKQRALETDTVLIAQRGRRVSLRLLL